MILVRSPSEYIGPVCAIEYWQSITKHFNWIAEYMVVNISVKFALSCPNDNYRLSIVFAQFR